MPGSVPATNGSRFTYFSYLTTLSEEFLLSTPDFPGSSPTERSQMRRLYDCIPESFKSDIVQYCQSVCPTEKRNTYLWSIRPSQAPVKISAPPFRNNYCNIHCCKRFGLFYIYNISSIG